MEDANANALSSSVAEAVSPAPPSSSSSASSPQPIITYPMLGHHGGPISSMDMCLRKPLLVCMSAQAAAGMYVCTSRCGWYVSAQATAGEPFLCSLVCLFAGLFACLLLLFCP
jgi:hypothetical protein